MLTSQLTDLIDEEAAIPIYDYVIAYNSDHQTIINLFKTKLVDKGLSYTEVDSGENAKMIYILITADKREVLTKRAEMTRVSVPIKMVKVADMMKHKPGPETDGNQDYCVRTSIDTGRRPANAKKPSRRQIVKQFVKDWFRPKLVGGHIKFVYQQKYDQLFLNYDNDPFQNSSRIRSSLVHDLIKDIELTRDLKTVKPGEVSRDKEQHSHDYRGLEWLKKKGYVKKSFVPHSDRDRQSFEENRKEKHHRYPIQSVTAFREYFGEKVAFAFAWRAAWLSWGLTIPALIGVIVSLADLFVYCSRGKCSKSTSINNNNTFTNDTGTLEFGFFDNELLPFYAILSLLLQMIGFSLGWSRYKFIYSFKWGMLNYFLVNERQLVMNSTLKDLTKNRKLLSRIWSMTTGVAILVGMVLFNFCVFIVQQALRGLLSGRLSVPENVAFYISTIVVSLVNTIFVVLFLNRKFANKAKQLCDNEYHTFPSDYERYLTWKVFFYNFTANNMRLLLMTLAPKIEFPFNIPYITLPGEHFSMQFCEEGKCVNTIFIQLSFFLIFKPLTSFLAYRKDDILRWCKIKGKLMFSAFTCSGNRYCRPAWDDMGHPELISNLDNEYRLYESDRFGERNQTLMDLNDKVAQYGFVIMFGSVFPLSPLIAAAMEIITRHQDVTR
ncbi:anoctamin-3-like isoform X2 [Bolinopsis microptera]